MRLPPRPEALPLLAFLAAAGRALAVPEASGRWEGELAIPGAPLPIVLYAIE